MNKEQKLLEVDKKIAKVSILSVPGPLLLGFGLLGRYGEPDEIPFQFLNDGRIVDLMLLAGALIVAGTGYVVFKLALEKARAQSETGK